MSGIIWSRWNPGRARQDQHEDRDGQDDRDDRARVAQAAREGLRRRALLVDERVVGYLLLFDGRLGGWSAGGRSAGRCAIVAHAGCTRPLPRSRWTSLANGIATRTRREPRAGDERECRPSPPGTARPCRADRRRSVYATPTSSTVWASDAAAPASALARGELGRAAVAVADHQPRVPGLDVVEQRNELFELRFPALAPGAGTKAVERMGHADDAALVADELRRLVRREAGRDRPLEVQADQVARAGAHLLADDHVEMSSVAFARASSAPSSRS